MNPESIVNMILQRKPRDLYKSLAQHGINILFYSVYIDQVDGDYIAFYVVTLHVSKLNKIWHIRARKNLRTGKSGYEVWEGKFEPMLTDALCDEYIGNVREVIYEYEKLLIGE